VLLFLKMMPLTDTGSLLSIIFPQIDLLTGAHAYLAHKTTPLAIEFSEMNPLST